MTQDFLHKIGQWIVKYKWAIVITNLLILGLLVGALANRGKQFQAHYNYMKNLQKNPLAVDTGHISPPPIMDFDYHVWFTDDNPQSNAYDSFQKIYSKEEIMIIVAVSKSKNLFTKDNLNSLKMMTDSAWTIPYVNRVDGLSNFNYTYVDNDDLLIEAFIPKLDLSDSLIAIKKQLAFSDPIMPKFLISKAGDISPIQLRAIVPRDFPEGYKESLNAAKALAKRIEANNPDIEFNFGGTVPLNVAFEEYATSDMQNLLPLTFAFIILILIISLRSVVATIAPIIILITSILFPIALFVGVFEYSLNNVTMSVTQILLAVAIADSVHVLAVFLKVKKSGVSRSEAVIYTVQKTFVACFLTSITTAIGFYTLLMMKVPPFQDLGLFAGTGTLYAWVASNIILPAVLAIIPYKKSIIKEGDEQINTKGYEKYVAFLVAYQRPIRWFTYSSTIIAVIFVLFINIDNNPIHYFEKTAPFRIATEYINENIMGVDAIEFNFDSGEENGIYHPTFLKKIEKFQEYIASKPEYNITYTAGITDIIKRINKTMNANNEAYFKIPSEMEINKDGDTINGKKLIAQYFLLYNMSLPQGMEMTNQIDIKNSSTRVTCFMKTGSSFKQIEITNEIQSWMSKEMPDIKTEAMGVPIMFGQLMKVAIPSMLQSMLTSFILITLSLMITFRSFRVGLYSMIPNLWPLIIVFGAIGILQVEVNLSIAIVGMITLGIVVDDTIHFLSKYLIAMEEGKTKIEAILYTFRQVGSALIFTSIILVFGFGALILSKFAPNADMALYSAIIIALALFADFVLLPAVILKYDKRK